MKMRPLWINLTKKAFVPSYRMLSNSISRSLHPSPYLYLVVYGPILPSLTNCDIHVDLYILHRYLGPAEASRGFKKAFLILQKNPSAASASLSATNVMRPLHLLLMLDAPLMKDDPKKKVNHHKAKEASQAAATAVRDNRCTV